MVAYQYRFAKVLTIREQEKAETEIAYKESIRCFENVATKLYEFVKERKKIRSMHKRTT